MLDEIFKKIQASQTTQPGGYKSTKNENILSMDPGKTKEGNTYLVRILPYLKKPEATFVSFMNHGWESKKNGKYISIPCLKTWGRQEKCPTCETRFAELKIGSDAAKAKARLLRQKTTNFVNAYVIDSPNKDDIGKVKIIRYGAEIDKILKAAVSGEDAEEFGMKVFDLSPAGVDFRIRVTSKGEGREAMPTYATSKFVSKPHDLGLSGKDIQAILDLAHDLTALMPERKTDADIEKVLNEHYFTNQDRANPVTEYVSDEAVEDDDAPPFKEEPKAKPAKQSKAISASTENVDQKVEDLLAEFSLPSE